MARNAFSAGLRARKNSRARILCGICGAAQIPLFGKDRMTTFERYLVEDKASWEEHKNPYYKYTVHGTPAGASWRNSA